MTSQNQRRVLILLLTSDVSNNPKTRAFVSHKLIGLCCVGKVGCADKGIGEISGKALERMQNLNGG
jgi:hypothetical protein